ncbi:MAG: type III-A CRISPR-associated protein Cas10/Csm1 [Thermodesulforhabdaceae bacterium]
MEVGISSTIALAALLHDVGKFAQYAVSLPEGYRERNADLYQPFWNNRYYTHSHALFTAYFLESMKNFIPEGFWNPNASTVRGVAPDSLINLAAMHHKPETPAQWVIAEADRLSSGSDRDEFTEGKAIPVSDAIKTKLIPVFEMLFSSADASRDDFSWRYQIKPIDATTIFPQKDSSEGSDEDYRKLYADFSKAFTELAHKNKPLLWLQHLDSLYRTFTSHVPAARVGNVVHDVSLYDHSRTTAALAVALYRYHEETDTLREDAVKDRNPRKFLIVSGDFYGIQSFIFSVGGEQRGRRSKLLRGRSFSVSLLTELAAHEIAKSLKLSPLSVVMSAGGKFHLIAHNTAESRKKIEKVAQKLNDWLLDVTFGESALGITYTGFSPADLLNGRFESFWKRHIEAMEEKKFRRFDLSKHGGVFKDFLDRFRNDLYRPLCPFCGKRPSEEKVENDRAIARPNERASACGICRDHIFVGTKIVKKHRVAVIDSQQGDLVAPLFGKYQLKFVDPGSTSIDLKGLNVEKFWDVNIYDNGTVPTDVTFMPVNGYVPVYEAYDEHDERILAGARSEEAKLELIDMIREGDPKSFAHIASRALSFGDDGKLYGIDALGVLKADVDNLGAIFSCGFRGKRFTMSRMATLSRVLNNFFALYLPYALRNEEKGAFCDVYTVFAGGDDLFLIGPWNKIRDLAIFIVGKFRTYVCENRMVYISAGITLHKPSTPMDVIAEETEEALGMAKASGRNRVTMFGHSVSWDAFSCLVDEVRENLKKWLSEDVLSRSAFHRILKLVEMAEIEECAISRGKGVCITDIECVKWRAFLGYQVARNAAKKIRDKKDAQRVQTQIAGQLAKWINDYRGAMIIPFWSVLYDTRKKRDF